MVEVGRVGFRLAEGQEREPFFLLQVIERGVDRNAVNPSTNGGIPLEPGGVFMDLHKNILRNFLRIRRVLSVTDGRIIDLTAVQCVQLLKGLLVLIGNGLYQMKLLVQ